MPEKKLDEILNSAKESYKVFAANDTNLLVINNWKLLKESGFSVERNDSINKRLWELGKSDYPVMNFNQFNLAGGDRNSCQLSNDFRLFVISATKGNLFDFSSANRSYVPPQWEHGFSKGLAISEKQEIIIYWYAAW